MPHTSPARGQRLTLDHLWLVLYLGVLLAMLVSVSIYLESSGMSPSEQALFWIEVFNDSRSSQP